jgi:hypothetical protein
MAKKRKPNIEEFIQSLRTNKSHKVKKIKNTENNGVRSYAFETRKGEKFDLHFHAGKGKGRGSNPHARMRLEIEDADTIYQTDPAHNPAHPKLVLKMKHIGLWTPKEIMLFVMENLGMPDQENYNQFFGPEPIIEVVIENEDGPPTVGAEREFKCTSIIHIDSGLTSKLRKDFFTA